MFTYEDFIAEIRLLAAEARQFATKTDIDVVFQQWRHRLEDVITRVRAEGYRPACDIYARTFNNMWARNQKEAENTFTWALEKTLVEMDALVVSFEKFGPPKTANESYNRVGSTAAPAPSQTLHIYGGIHGGQVQIGDHNTQNVVNALRELKNKIDNADASSEQKKEAAGLLRSLLTHPLVTSVLGGLASGIF